MLIRGNTNSPGDEPVRHRAQALDRAREDQAQALVAAGTEIVPTLIMMRTIVEVVNPGGGPGPQAARASVATLREAGMAIIAGTDANRSPGAPAAPPFGASLHDELELLVDAGLTPVEAIHAATSVPAGRFGLDDRGRIEAGARADLVLLDEDPASGISAVRSIRGVWCAGVRRA
jgi:imidazolonepropionase-like amidohydrolase